MKNPRNRKQKRIDWQRVIGEGTGFFGWPSLNIPGAMPSGWEARQAVWSRMEPVISEATSLGADGDFLRACCLHLAEIAVKRHHSQDTVQLSDKRVRLGGLREVLKQRIEEMRQDSEKLRNRWTETKEAASSHLPQLIGADRVDSALSAVDDALTDFLHFYFPFEKKDKSSGRPDLYFSLSALSGMAWHLRDKIRKPAYKREPARYLLLSQITRTLIPPLPMATMPERLRSQISRHRGEQGTNGEAECDALMKEYRTMSRRFLA